MKKKVMMIEKVQELKTLNEKNGGKWFSHCERNGEKLSDFNIRQNEEFPEVLDLIDLRKDEVAAYFRKSTGLVVSICDGEVCGGHLSISLNKSNYYATQLSRMESVKDIPMAIQIRDSDCKTSHWININNESIPFIVEFLNKQMKG